ncbi:hypothetical protein E2C01_069566 [Portunus trituberculatus]|uniref:Uncharacterized protein n=1 Tax=Portunus trituberculatus TaxID=210409 RepID=A0A5B7HUW1_PORTR|nr:hypothetical protein [Portunus trituberculatus]
MCEAGAAGSHSSLWCLANTGLTVNREPRPYLWHYHLLTTTAQFERGILAIRLPGNM